MKGPRHAVIGALAAITLLATAIPAVAAPDDQLITDPTRLVDPMIGTGKGGPVVGEINTFPGPTAPFGMIQWSPDNGNYAGYNYHAGPIRGFSLTHASVGCSAFGDIPILPVAGALGTTPWNRTEKFSHSTETAEVGHYGVTLADSGIRAELTATTRAGLGTFTYPSGTPAHVLVKTGASLAGNSAATVTLTAPDEITGSATSGRFCGEGGNSYTVHFALKFDRPYTAHGTWDSTTLTPGGTSANHPKSGAYLTFDTTADRTLRAKVALSYVSTDGARANLSEIPGWNPTPVRTATREQWRQALRRIRVGGGTDAHRRTFYTALYHSLIHPNTFNDVDGRYIGFDGKIHQVEQGRTHYANFSDWDTYRCLAPLHGWLYPDRAADMAQSLVLAAEQGGWLPRWPMANGYTSVMNGDNSVPLLVNLHAYGATAFDTRTALRYMLKGATKAEPVQWGYVERQGIEDYQKLGYVPNDRALVGHVRKGASQTLEYAVDDFTISRFARTLGDTTTAAAFAKRGEYWRNLFDPNTGYLRPKDSLGKFPEGPGFVPPPPGQFGQDGFEEGNAAQYRWFVPHNIAGLVRELGGNTAAQPLMDEFFKKVNVGPNEPHQWSGNEVDFSTPWLYNYVGQPWKTQAVIRRIQNELFAPHPDGLPGNDDLGAQSSWYVWSALGLYPVTPGTSDLSVHTPLFPRIDITPPNGRGVRITAPGAGNTKPYLDSLRLNGAPWPKTWLPQNLVHTGGTLDFTVRATPNTTWATTPDAAPPSYP
ncbi:putative alpha-1,2-mannosidase [Crossiella equi]|uniref:Alpha-1,2-mannosidase n=1 Tax=Crossiella equi TaxID=130796 RepID=A0ABS5A461_9PSEU|nr:GH92 family glycosyl hydrolase [Crossiella equi]MBP2471360.1 putative alpha-1,2-mannosidase [Crossiella equi]